MSFETADWAEALRFYEWLKVDILNRGHEDGFRWRIDKRPDCTIAWRQSKSRLMSIVPAQNAADLFIPFPAARPYHYQEPCLIDAPPWMAADLDARFAKNPAKAPAGGLAFFRNAVVLSQGCILTSDGRVVAESLTHTEDERAFWPFERSKDGASITIDIGRRYLMDNDPSGTNVLIKQCYDSNYGHWLIEGLPRAGVFSEMFGIDRVKFIIRRVQDDMRDVYLDSLRRFGIDRSQIIETDDRPQFFENLLYPLPMNSVSQVTINPRSIATLEKISDVSTSSHTPSRRIYVSRNKTNTRVLINEDEIIEICRSFGFEPIFPELLPFDEKVRYFSHADFVVGACGAGLANMAFSPRGATVIALTSEFLSDHFYWDLASIKGIKYISIHGKSIGKIAPETRVENARLDFSIDPAVLRRTLSDALETHQRTFPPVTVHGAEEERVAIPR